MVLNLSKRKVAALQLAFAFDQKAQRVDVGHLAGVHTVARPEGQHQAIAGRDGYTANWLWLRAILCCGFAVVKANTLQRTKLEVLEVGRIFFLISL